MQIEITKGPSKEELFDSLAEGTPVTFDFKYPNRKVGVKSVSLRITSLGLKDGSRTSFHFQAEPADGKPSLGYIGWWDTVSKYGYEQ